MRKEGGLGPNGEGGGGWVLSRDAVRRIDRLAAERFGLPTIVLMENAAIGLRGRALARLRADGLQSAVIVAGPGNNGGDGLALARHLHNAGWPVRVLMTTDPGAIGGDAGVQVGVVRAMGIGMDRLDRAGGAEALELALRERTLVVDALLGTGLRDAARGVVRDVILQINRREAGARVLAVDVPSGLDCDTGEPAGGGEAVEADETVTFVGLKPGFLRLAAQRWTGDVTVVGIGVPRELIESLGQPAADSRRGPVGSERTAGEPGQGPASGPPSSHARGGPGPGEV
ncbi:MAG: NAD(P)H-hydrate epimerase [Phycisphaerales bacterium]|nr:NAD(P)H-hydrate epimerase [Phycisphaerales bacterium]